MNNYICKIADLNEMNTKWDYEISIHPGDISWSLYKTKFIESAKKGNRVSYYGILNGKIISIIPSVRVQSSTAKGVVCGIVPSVTDNL